MAKNFILCDRDTLYFMPPSIQEWVPENHLVRFVIDIVEQLDVTDLEKQYSQRGGKAYPVKMMLALMFYGYITGTYSSRKIERATYDLIPFTGLCPILKSSYQS